MFYFFNNKGINMIYKHGEIYICSDPEFIGGKPIKTELEAIPTDESKKDIGFMCWEVTDEDIAKENLSENVEKRKQERNSTNLSDKYITNHGVKYSSDGRCCWTVIPVLEFLKGKPWDNMALNFVHALRPSMIRVTTGTVTCDAYTWRVTVYVEQDNKTIKKIEQEVDAGAIGVRNGQDLSYYINGHDEYIDKEQPSCIINTKAIKKLKLELKEQ